MKKKKEHDNHAYISISDDEEFEQESDGYEAILPLSPIILFACSSFILFLIIMKQLFSGI